MIVSESKKTDVFLLNKICSINIISSTLYLLRHYEMWLIYTKKKFYLAKESTKLLNYRRGKMENILYFSSLHTQKKTTNRNNFRSVS